MHIIDENINLYFGLTLALNHETINTNNQYKVFFETCNQSQYKVDEIKTAKIRDKIHLKTHTSIAKRKGKLYITR